MPAPPPDAELAPGRSARKSTRNCQRQLLTQPADNESLPPSHSRLPRSAGQAQPLPPPAHGLHAALRCGLDRPAASAAIHIRTVLRLRACHDIVNLAAEPLVSPPLRSLRPRPRRLPQPPQRPPHPRHRRRFPTRRCERASLFTLTSPFAPAQLTTTHPRRHRPPPEPPARLAAPPLLQRPTGRSASSHASNAGSLFGHATVSDERGVCRAVVLAGAAYSIAANCTGFYPFGWVARAQPRLPLPTLRRTATRDALRRRGRTTPLPLPLPVLLSFGASAAPPRPARPL